MSVNDSDVPQRVKLVFVDGNLSTGVVVAKKGTIVEVDDSYIYFIPDDDRDAKHDPRVRIGHNFVVKTVPLREESR